MSALTAALAVELRKALASRVLLSTTVLLVAGIAALAGALVASARAGDEQILAQLGPLAEETGWPLLTGVSAQITAVGAMLGFGVALSWSVGREFADGTITGLFALPVPRSVIVLAKLCLHLVWVVLVATALTVLVLGAGLALGLGPVTGDVVALLARQFALALAGGLLVMPAAWAATLGRGLLPGIAVTVGLLIAAQISAIASPVAAAWVPLSVPALWALAPEAVGAGQLVLVLSVPLTFGALTTWSWARMQLDR